jgi:ATP/ADP translocase
LITAFLSHILCSFSSELAYVFVHQHERPAGADNLRVANSKDEEAQKLPKLGVWGESLALMKKHPTLQILFMEAIFHQLVVNMLNLMFHDALRMGISNDDERAKLVSFFSDCIFILCIFHFLYLRHRSDAFLQQ